MDVTDENWELVVEEIAVLTSIFGQKDFVLDRAEGIWGLHGSPSEALEWIGGVAHPNNLPWTVNCTMLIQVELPLGRLAVQLADPPPRQIVAAGQLPSTPDPSSSSNSSGGGAGHEPGYVVRFLPPITLKLQLHPCYPSAEPPKVLSLSAAWLTASQASVLEAQLLHLWEEQRGLPVCYTWAEWLRTSALHYLGAEEALVLSSEMIGLGQAPAAALRAGEASGNAAGLQPLEGGEQHPKQLLHRLLRYNSAKGAEEYESSMHKCSICFEEHPGTRCTRLPCGHSHNCTSCLREHCKLHVKEGSIEQLVCPEPGCGDVLPPQVLRQLLSPEEFSRWDELALQREVERMRDACYCPHCSMLCLQDRDSLAQCPRCLFAFCGRCQKAWHPGSECHTQTKQLDDKEKRRGKGIVDGLRRIEQEQATFAERTCRRCPTCGWGIQKDGGCNIVICTRCDTYFDYDLDAEECQLFDDSELEEIKRSKQHLVSKAEKKVAYLLRNSPNTKACYCPSCGRSNYKLGMDNNIKCLACGAHFCFLCRHVLLGRGGDHFSKDGCRQHTTE